MVNVEVLLPTTFVALPRHRMRLDEYRAHQIDIDDGAALVLPREHDGDRVLPRHRGPVRIGGFMRSIEHVSIPIWRKPYPDECALTAAQLWQTGLFASFP